jgi:glycogen debranching enzyme
MDPPAEKDLRGWLAEAPRLSSGWAPLARIYRRSLIDLAALRFRPRIVPGGALPAAGLPWFMSIFGRDSIITSFQALPFVPELARTTLRALALWQGEPDGDGYVEYERREPTGRENRSEAADLERRSNSDFWLADRQCFALAIDGDGRRVDSLTSKRSSENRWSAHSRQRTRSISASRRQASTSSS